MDRVRVGGWGRSNEHTRSTVTSELSYLIITETQKIVRPLKSIGKPVTHLTELSYIFSIHTVLLENERDT